MANTKNPVPPSLTALLNEQKRDTQLAINCVQIGTIQEFDPSNQTATIQLALKQVAVENPDGTKVLKEYPVLLECPVITLFGGLDFLSMPITSGDSCVVFFNDRDMDQWFTSGGVQAPTTPRVHDLADGIAIVGIRPLVNSIATYLANGIRLSHGAGDNLSKMDFTDALIAATADLFYHHGDVRISGNLTIDGDTYGNGGNNWNLRANLIQEAGRSIHAGNGATGTFNTVTVVDGIVISGT